jgi:hypothetical protein
MPHADSDDRAASRLGIVRSRDCMEGKGILSVSAGALTIWLYSGMNKTSHVEAGGSSSVQARD